MKFEFSAGGIVYKLEKNKLFILVSQHSQHKGWVFPKGLIGNNIEGEKKSASAKSSGPLRQSSSEASETKEEAAVREVEEETGVKAEILEQITPVTYWYVWPREAGSRSAGEKDKRKKTVYYFIMKAVGGDITKHDDEMMAVEWLAEDKVLERLTYKGDKGAFEEALPRIQALAKS